jgi:hypothetical protein
LALRKAFSHIATPYPQVRLALISQFLVS